MKYILIPVFLFVSSSWASGEMKENKSTLAAEGKERLRYELIDKLIENGNLSLSNKKYCENFVKNKHETVGRFMAWSLSFYSSGQDNSVEAACEKLKIGEFCSVTFKADSKGGSPWSCGLRFRYDAKKREIQNSSLECIGSC